MNFGKGGQNIVQSGSNNPNVFKGAGNILGTFLGTKMRRQERDYHREKDYAARKDFEDYKNESKVKSNLLEGIMSPHVIGNYFDVANETHDENSPEVINKVENPETGVAYKAGDLKRPQFAGFVNNYGVQTSKHGILPGQPAKGVLQEQERNKRRNADTKIPSAEPFEKSDVNDEAGTIPKFGKDASGNVTVNRKEITLNDINKKRRSIAKVGYENAKPVNNVPMSMRTEDSVAPTDRAWTPEQKASLESERPAPRTENLNTGINDGKGGNY